MLIQLHLLEIKLEVDVKIPKEKLAVNTDI
jgi:hypothetical protein